LRMLTSAPMRRDNAAGERSPSTIAARDPLGGNPRRKCPPRRLRSRERIDANREGGGESRECRIRADQFDPSGFDDLSRFSSTRGAEDEERARRCLGNRTLPFAQISTRRASFDRETRLTDCRRRAFTKEPPVAALPCSPAHPFPTRSRVESRMRFTVAARFIAASRL